MKEVTLYEVKEVKILVEDYTNSIRQFSLQNPPDHVIGGYGEVIIGPMRREKEYPVKCLSRMVNHEEVVRSGRTVQPVYEERYYALSPAAEELMTVTGLYDDNQYLQQELENRNAELKCTKNRIDALTSTTFFGRLKMLFTGVK